MIVEGMPLFWAVMAKSVYTRGSEIMLKSLANPTALGYYAAANKIADLYLLLPNAILASATPIISKSKTQDRTLYLTQMTRLLRVTAAIGISSTLVTVLVAHWLMPIIYGPSFAGSSAVLAINMWSAVPVSFSMITSLWVINEDIAPIQFQKVLFMAVIVFLSNWFLIPQFGAPGAAMSTLIGSILVNIVWDFIDPRMRNFCFLKLHAFLPWWFGLGNI
jgi:PST family polysaccharide transporter